MKSKSYKLQLNFKFVQPSYVNSD